MKYGCDNCKYRFFPVTRSPCDNCAMSGDKYSEWTAQTNADRIRNMTDEELAMFLSHDAGWRWECETCKKPNRNKMKGSDCENCWLAWLKEEVKG